MPRLAVAFITALLFLPQSAPSFEIYKWRSGGRTEYSDRPPRQTSRQRSDREHEAVRILRLRSWAGGRWERRIPGDRRDRRKASVSIAASQGFADSVDHTSGADNATQTMPETGSEGPVTAMGSLPIQSPDADDAATAAAAEPAPEPVSETASLQPAAQSVDDEPIASLTALDPPDETSRVQSESLPVFPGAEGFGTYTRAGRGGRVIAVTSLEDSGPGSLREALERSGPRTIVFRVGGVIELEDFLFVRHPFVTVAGQTAPGDGITLKNFGVIVPTNDVLIQHLRVRPGDTGDMDPTGNDAIAIFGQHGSVSGAYNVVIDHVSASWSEDEVVSTWFAPHDVTISWSILSEALRASRHPKSTHSAGLLIGDGSNRISVRNSLLAHNDFRNPLIIGGGEHDFSNNVIYDWGDISTEIVDDAPSTYVMLLGNRYIPGPSTRRAHEMLVNPTGSSNMLKVFMRDNVAPSFGSAGNGDWMLYYGWEGTVAPTRFRSLEPLSGISLPDTGTAARVHEVLSQAGATLPSRDAVDARVVAQVERGNGSIIDSPNDVGGYPLHSQGIPLADSDADGVPDFWESQLGFDPHRSDSNGDKDGDGYTNLEEYLHALTR